MSLADLPARSRSVESSASWLPSTASRSYEELEHSDLVLKLLDAVPLTPASPAASRTASRESLPASWRSSTRASASCAATA